MRVSIDPPIRPAILGAALLPTEALPGIDAGPRENLSHRAYLRIRSSLVQSELQPGQRLVLRPLAAELRLSPTPVREALLRLVSEQAPALDERGSAIVPVIGIDELHEIIDIRCDLEGRAAGLAASRATAAEIETVAALARTYEEAANGQDRRTMLARNADLHRLVCRIARAPLILRILEGIWMRIGPVYALGIGERPTVPLAEHAHPHDQIVAALRERSADAARAAMIADITGSARWLARCLVQAS